MADETVKILLEGQDKSKDAFNSVDRSLDSLGSRATNVSSSTGSALGSIAKGVAGYGAIAAGALSVAGGFAIKSASDMQMLRTNLDTLTGSAEKGREMFTKLYDFAAKTPFETPELADAAQMLLSYGVSADKIMPSLQMLGDVSLGNKTKFQGLSLAFSQVQATGRLMGQDLLQMVNQGFNPLQVISEKTGRSMLDLKKDMEEGKISADMVTEAFTIATSEGGRFYQGMDKGSKTLQGTWSTLMDTVGMVARKIVGLSETGDIIQGGLFDKIATGVASVNEWFTKHQDLINAIVNAIMGGLSSAINWLIGSIKGLADGITYFFTQTESGKSIMEGFGILINFVKEQATNLWKIIQDNKDIFEFLGTVLLGLAGGAVLAIIGAIGGIIFVIGKVIEGIGWFKDSLINMYNTVINFFSDLPGNLARLAGEAVGWIVGQIALLPSRIWEVMQFTWQKLKDAFDWIKKDSGDWAKDTIINIVEYFLSLPKKIYDGITSSVKAIGGWIEKFFEGFGKGFTVAVEGKASGGVVKAGQSYLVGEKGMEMFVPSVSGTIIPNNKLNDYQGGNRQINITQYNNINYETDAIAIGRELGFELARLR